MVNLLKAQVVRARFDLQSTALYFITPNVATPRVHAVRLSRPSWFYIANSYNLTNLSCYTDLDWFVDTPQVAHSPPPHHFNF